MQPRTLNRTFLTVTQVIVIIVCLSAVATAQTPTPQPSPATTQASPNGSSFSQTLAQMASRATELLPLVRNEIEVPLLPWLEKLSLLLAGLITIAAFARLWRENAGAGVDLFWWFARLGIILALLGNGPRIVDGMFVVGREIAVGEDGSGALFQFYVKQRFNFDAAYSRFTEGVFTVKDTSVKPVPGGIMGVIYSTETSVLDATRKLDNLSKDMSFLFDSLNFSRGVLTFGDFFLTVLGSFLMIAMRLSAPVMIALAIDRSVAQKVTYPFIWGVAVLTLIWPVVVVLIKSIAYMGGNIAMALGDNQQFYQFDPKTMQIIQNTSQQPVYTVLFAAAIMLIAGLCLWGAPYIAYQLSVGRVYEGVSTTISSWAGQIAGAGIEYYSSSMAASLSRQAEVMQAKSQEFAEVTRAGAGLERDNLQARASKIVGVTGAQGSLTNQLAGIEAGRTQQVLGFEADNRFNQRAVDSQKKLSIGDQQALRERGLTETEVDRAAREQEWIGGKVIRASDWGGNVVRSATSGSDKQAVRAGGAIVGEGIKVAGGAYGLYQQYQSIQNRAAGNTGAIIAYSDKTVQNQEDFAGAMKGANAMRMDDFSKAAYTGAAMSSAGARSGYTITVGGYNQAYNLNLRGNQISYRGAIEAAGIVRESAVEAAKLRSVASIIGSVGHNIARDIEQGLTLRY